MAPKTPTPEDEQRGLLMADAREALGLTQDQVAERLRTTKNTVSRWETGEMTPRRPKGAALERMYRLAPGTLTGGIPVHVVPRGTPSRHEAPGLDERTVGALWAAEQMSESLTRLIRRAREGIPASASGGAPGLASTDAFGEAPPGLPDQAKRQG